jgi:hypothetical protein
MSHYDARVNILAARMTHSAALELPIRQGLAHPADFPKLTPTSSPPRRLKVVPTWYNAHKQHQMELKSIKAKHLVTEGPSPPQCFPLVRSNSHITYIFSSVPSPLASLEARPPTLTTHNTQPFQLPFQNHLKPLKLT